MSVDEVENVICSWVDLRNGFDMVLKWCRSGFVRAAPNSNFVQGSRSRRRSLNKLQEQIKCAYVLDLVNARGERSNCTAKDPLTSAEKSRS